LGWMSAQESSHRACLHHKKVALCPSGKSFFSSVVKSTHPGREEYSSTFGGPASQPCPSGSFVICPCEVGQRALVSCLQLDCSVGTLRNFIKPLSVLGKTTKLSWESRKARINFSHVFFTFLFITKTATGRSQPRGGHSIASNWKIPPGSVLFPYRPLALRGGMAIKSLSDLKGSDDGAGDGVPSEAMEGPVDGEKLSKYFMGLYHEKQIGALCAVHCLNNLLQRPEFDEIELAEIAAEMDRYVFDRLDVGTLFSSCSP
jgi:hypothetical protein